MIPRSEKRQYMPVVMGRCHTSPANLPAKRSLIAVPPVKSDPGIAQEVMRLLPWLSIGRMAPETYDCRAVARATLRHSCAVALLQAGVDLVII
jgi:hypothetical protein